MKSKILTLIFFLSCNFLSAQSPYFQNRYAFESTNTNGLEITSTNGEYQIATALRKDDILGRTVWYTGFTSSDSYGNMSETKFYNTTYLDTLSSHWTPRGSCILGDSISVLCGFTTHFSDFGTFEENSFVLFLDEQGDSTAFYSYRFNDSNSGFYSISAMSNNSLLVVGSTIYNGYTEPLIVNISLTGEVIWENVYSLNNGAGNLLKSVTVDDEGYIYAAGVSDLTGDPKDANILLLRCNSTGFETHRRILDFGFGDEPTSIQLDSNGWPIISTLRAQSMFSDYLGEGMLVKISPFFGFVQWEIEVFNNQLVQDFVILEDGSFVACGSHKFEGGAVDLGLAKIAADGSELLWRRFYGGSWSDYAYDMCKTPEGGFAMVGRSDSLVVAEEGGGAYMYMVKTNCLGLLTEPEASFSAEQNLEDPLLVEFINESLFVYPDSIDGGLFVWDFGDGTNSTEINPQHLYSEPGYYTVNLEAIVCSDTSRFVQSISTYPLGIEEEKSAEVLQIVPNPVLDIGQIEFDLSSLNAFNNAELNLFSFTGQLIENYKLKSLKGIQSLSKLELATGVYFIQLVIDGKQQASKKMTVK